MAEVARARRRLADRDDLLAWIFLLPSVVYIVALVAVPFFLAIGFALSDVTAGDPSYDFVGLANFRAIFDDPVFWRSLGNTFLFTTASMLFIVVFGKVLANILVANFRGKWLVRLLVLLPWTTPAALGAIAWAPGTIMVAGGIAGGYAAAATARRVDERYVRNLVTVIAWGMTLYFFLR